MVFSADRKGSQSRQSERLRHPPKEPSGPAVVGHRKSIRAGHAGRRMKTQSDNMPVINIRLARRETPTTAEQKAALIAGITDLMHQVLAKRRESVVVIIDEVEPENWGEGGEAVTVIRKRRQT